MLFVAVLLKTTSHRLVMVAELVRAESGIESETDDLLRPNKLLAM